MHEPGVDEAQGDLGTDHGAGNECAGRADDARFVISSVQSTITGADTKASIVATMLTVFLGLVVPALIRANAWDMAAPWSILAALTGVGSGIAAVVIAIELLRVLIPRLVVSEHSRYAFPDVALRSVDELVAAGSASDRREAWVQAHTLSLISAGKHRHLGRAMRWFPIVIVLGIATVLLAAASPGANG
jgi:hypothetical protein